MPMTRCPSWQWSELTANGVPAVAFYMDGEAWSITLLTPRDGRIGAITSFLEPAPFDRFELPRIRPPAGDR
ncbi:hypothetical protein KOI35_02605 [Actinoplanes bogorensis]|uniref:Uncharacterized protein n=1 Tax=Paractinoplanes bogorensis TaxID=1610840 RepID=A0ABS5YGA3_9ACTN|nr:hypothetical protein [Actinoplanes bogorensis]MBU2662393.1 hypothetical protein [Actinoplanes bogorensis]